MIIIIDASILQLREQRRHFNWNRPICTCGCKKVWGHGFVSRILDDCTVELKRFLCPGCGKTFTLRPRGFWPRFQTCVLTMFLALAAILTMGRWPQPSRRQRMRHWMCRFERLAAGHFPSENLILLLERLQASEVSFLI